MTTKRKNKISGWFRKIPLNIGTFIFGALFVYMVITVILYLTADHIQSYQVTAGPLSNNKTYTALAIREESVVNTNAAGYITYYARENSKVGKSGAVYTLGDTPAQAAVNELTEQDYAGIRSSIAGFASTYDSDNFYDVYNYKYELEGSILQYSVFRRMTPRKLRRRPMDRQFTGQHRMVSLFIQWMATKGLQQIS
ncbi:hypothetical protein DWY34_11355 [Blautia sp. AF25-12LB]|nr:hypothetical protein DWY34_11355 [Blautia sp. AF25-12LB]